MLQEPTELCLKLFNMTPIMNRARLEIDGRPCNLRNFWSLYYPGALIRLNKHLYCDGIVLTEDSPAWSQLWQ